MSAALERVCCLECGTAYGKPRLGGTISTNPGCPECGYLGWVPEPGRLRAATLRDRSVADRPRRPSARAG